MLTGNDCGETVTSRKFNSYKNRQGAAQLLGKDSNSLRLVTCHLGNGCSLAAIREGHSIDTTMGFTPLEGPMMGTRSGSVDPGILTYLIRKDGLHAQDLDDMLNQNSGSWGFLEFPVACGKYSLQ
jgi:acetate kinase